MTSCELCGSIKPPLVFAEVEGSRLTVCRACSAYGKVLPFQQRFQPNSKTSGSKNNLGNQQALPLKKEPVTYEAVVQEYAQRIREAREKLKLTQQEFAKHITEKESMVSHWESGSIEPSLDTAKKIQHTLHIQLVEMRTEEPVIRSQKKSSAGLTIGDILAQKMK